MVYCSQERTCGDNLLHSTAPSSFKEDYSFHTYATFELAEWHATQHGRATPTHLSVDSGFKDATALYKSSSGSIGEFTALSELINVYLS